MSLRGSTVKQYPLPITPPSGRPGSRSWRPIYPSPCILRATKSLTVYDLLPAPLAEKGYQIWTQEWLPRLMEPADRSLNPSSRNPVGFAIAPNRITTNRAPDIGPVVLHFNGGGTVRSTEGKMEVRTKKVKPLRRVYTKSVFRRETKPERAELFHETRPLSTRKRLRERTVSISSASSLPRGYRLPEGGDERWKGADVMAEFRRDNYMLPERLKYVILSQAFNWPRVPEGGADSMMSSTRALPSRNGSVITTKGSLRHGLACKTGDLQQGHGDLMSPFLVTNSVTRSRSFDAVKVKDALDFGENKGNESENENLRT